MSAIQLDNGDALLVIDMQDAMLPDGHEVIAPINHLLALYREHRLPVFAFGASFPAELALPGETVVIPQAARPAADTCSAFKGTALARRLHERGVRRIAVCGLATDDCVLGTVTDALAEGFDTLVVPEAMRAVEVAPGDGTRAIDRMVARGAVAVRLGETGMTALSVG